MWRTFTISTSLFLYLESWTTLFTATISLFLLIRPLNTFPKVPYPIISSSSTSSVKRDDGVESRLISVIIFLIFLGDFCLLKACRLRAYRLFDFLGLSARVILSVYSSFHFAWDFCCLIFFSPFFSLSLLLWIGPPSSVNSFLVLNLETVGDSIFSLKVLLVADVAR